MRSTIYLFVIFASIILNSALSANTYGNLEVVVEPKKSAFGFFTNNDRIAIRISISNNLSQPTEASVFNKLLHLSSQVTRDSFNSDFSLGPYSNETVEFLIPPLPSGDWLLITNLISGNETHRTSQTTIDTFLEIHSLFDYYQIVAVTGGIIGAGVAIVAVILQYYSSKNSLHQMQKQNDLTRNNMLFQLRPWIGKILSFNGSNIDDTSLQEERFFPSIADSGRPRPDPFRTHYIYIHNYGKIPALTFRMRHAIISDPDRIQLDRNSPNFIKQFFELQINDDDSIPGQIMPQQTVKVGFNHDIISLERYAIFQFQYTYLDHQGFYRVILEFENSSWNCIFEESS